VTSSFAQALTERLTEAGLSPGAAHLQQLERFYLLLKQWNERINLTALPLDDKPSPKTLDRLFVEPALGAHLVEGRCAVQYDLGSGSGSPAIPLRILAVSETLVMVESRERKSAFLRECINQLGLQGSEVLTFRVQKIPPERYGTADLVTIRALKTGSDVLAVVKSLLSSAGQLLTFGGEAPEGFRCDRELKAPDGSTIRLSQPTERFQ